MNDILEQYGGALRLRAIHHGFVPLAARYLQCVECWNRRKLQQPLRQMHGDGKYDKFRCISCDAQEMFRTELAVAFRHE